MTEESRDWRAVVRETGNVCLSPAEPDQDLRTRAFEVLRATAVARADQILLYGWEPGWSAAVPAESIPVWARELDRAPFAGGHGRSIKVLNRELWERHADALNEIKPRVRWKPAGPPFPAMPKSASAGDLLLRFAKAEALADAVRSGCSAPGLAASVVTSGSSNYFLPSTWRLLRRDAAMGAAAPVHVGLLGHERTLLCSSSASSLDVLLNGLAPLLRFR